MKIFSVAFLLMFILCTVYSKRRASFCVSQFCKEGEEQCRDNCIKVHCDGDNSKSRSCELDFDKKKCCCFGDNCWGDKDSSELFTSSCIDKPCYDNISQCNIDCRNVLCDGTTSNNKFCVHLSRKNFCCCFGEDCKVV